MSKYTGNTLLVLLLLTLTLSCAPRQSQLTVNTESVSPGTEITKKGQPLPLLGTPIEIGQQFPATRLIDSEKMTPVNLHDYRGSVLFLSIVPSIDTKVCEEQTHYLGEEGDTLPAEVKRITISRDTPFAHQRFAEAAKLEDILYLSDYQTGEFGRSLGLLVEGPLLLARSVILVDKQGIVRYIQVVPEITNLPDMEKAFAKAVELTR